MTNYSKKLISLCCKFNLTISVAESCTGGLIASNLVSVPGASKVFKVGLVTYSNQSKNYFLKVPLKVLKKYGAVSEETAKLMVKGLSLNSDSDIFLGITGIAGPKSESSDKPVGLVYHSFLLKNNNNIEVIKKYYKGSRKSIRNSATLYTIYHIYNVLNYLYK
jgi:PncC family amidohydrolase